MAENKLSLNICSISSAHVIAKVDYFYLSKKMSAEIELTNFLFEAVLQKLAWYYEHGEENTVHIKSVEIQLINEGANLFKQVFCNEQTKEIWKLAQSNLSSLVVEIVDNSGAMYLFPWEIIYDEASKEFLVRKVNSFCRTNLINGPKTEILHGKIKVLLVISRPMTYADIPLSTIANAIIGEFNEGTYFQFSILRPPTFENLSDVLQAAKAKGSPFHFVHFDGHGVHGSQNIVGLNPTKGYLVFESINMRAHVFIDGGRIGKLLYTCGVRAFVMNACRSGYVNYTATTGQSGLPIHSSSLAHDILTEGIDAVIGMKYVVSPFTARKFMKCFYKSLENSQSMVEAFNSARKQLVYENNDDSRNLDLFVPVLLKQRDIQFKKSSLLTGFSLKKLFSNFSKNKPDVNIFDDLIIQFEELAYQQNIIHIYGAIGSGKTSFFDALTVWSNRTNFADFAETITIKDESTLDQIFKRINAIAFKKKSLILIDDVDKCSCDTTSLLERLDQVKEKNTSCEITFVVSTRGKRSVTVLNNVAKVQIYVRDREFFKQLLSSLANMRDTGLEEINGYVMDFAIGVVKGNLQSLALVSTALKEVGIEKPGFKDVLYHQFFRLTALDTMVKLIEKKKLNDAIAGVAILHLLHNGFSFSLPESVLLSFGKIDASIIRKSIRVIEDAGLLIETVDNLFFQLHPFAVNHVTSVFEKHFPMEDQHSLVLATVNQLMEEIRRSVDFTRPLLLTNIPVIGIYILQRKMDLPQYQLLAFYIEKEGIKDVTWSVWIEKGFAFFAERVRGKGLTNSIWILADILAFTLYYIQLCATRLKYLETCEAINLLGDMEALIVRIGEMPSEQQEICIKLLTNIIIDFSNFETLLIKIESELVSNLTEPVKLASKAAFKLCKELNFSEQCAKLCLYEASFLLYKFTEVTDWYFQMMLKKLMFMKRSVRHPDPAVNFYFDTIQYFLAKNTSKRMKFFKMSVDSFLARSEEVGKELDQQDLAQLVFGKDYSERLSILQRLLTEAEAFAGGNLAIQKHILLIKRELKQAIRSKMRFYLLDIFDVVLFIDVNINISIGNLDHLLIQITKSRTKTEEDKYIESAMAAIFQIANIGPQDEEFGGIFAFADLLMNKEDYHRAIRLLEEEVDNAESSGIVEHILLQLEILAAMYHMCDRSDIIQFYATPAFTYMVTKLNALLDDSLERILGEDKNMVFSENFAEIFKHNQSEDNPYTQFRLLHLVIGKIESLKEMIEKEKKLQEESDILLEEYFRAQGKITDRKQLFEALKETDRLLRILNSLRRQNTSLIRKEMDLLNLQGAIVVDYFKDFSSGNIDTLGEQVYVLKRCQETIVSLKPYKDIEADIANTIDTLKALFELITPMMWEIIIYFVYTEDEKRDLTASERTMIISYSDIILTYFDSFYKEVNVPFLEKLMLEGKVTSLTILIEWKLEYMIKDLFFYTMKNENIEAPWEKLISINKLMMDVNKRGVLHTEKMKAHLYEYTLHWCMFSISGLIDKYLKAPLWEKSSLEEYLGFCFHYIFKEYCSGASQLSNLVPIEFRSRLVRNADRSVFESMCRKWEEANSRHAQEVKSEREETLKTLEDDIINK